MQGASISDWYGWYHQKYSQLNRWYRRTYPSLNKVVLANLNENAPCYILPSDATYKLMQPSCL